MLKRALPWGKIDNYVKKFSFIYTLRKRQLIAHLYSPEKFLLILYLVKISGKKRFLRKKELVRPYLWDYMNDMMLSLIIWWEIFSFTVPLSSFFQGQIKPLCIILPGKKHYHLTKENITYVEVSNIPLLDCRNFWNLCFNLSLKDWLAATLSSLEFKIYIFSFYNNFANL